MASSILHAAVPVPATMLVTGDINGGSVSVKKNAEVIAVEPGTTASVATGVVLDNSGTYSVEISKTTDFNGTQLTLIYSTGGNRYQLLSDGEALVFSFNGGLLPSRRTYGLTIGALISSSNGGDNGGSGGDSGGGGGTADASFDLNGDGKVDTKDTALIKQHVVSNAAYLAKYDVNSDKLINTRDIIDVIKAARAASLDR
ncbi:dockerin type I domain-containing protein [Aliamphritea hakodatensis]|uniref:dockerin type I domain-containing protein n=1 Tax=Aliamphritea hakodatensis TaxID=2895352 RepID=UPI0022FD5AA8|nr:dockerin type I domain-containing protein [Aliamphritea hakodatensis]